MSSKIITRECRHVALAISFLALAKIPKLTCYCEHHVPVVKVKTILKSGHISLHHRGSSNLRLGILSRLLRWCRILWRGIFHVATFSPALISLPIFLASETGSEFSQWWWHLLRDCFRESGPCTTKLAQWIATRPDLFPIQLCDNLQDLQSKAYLPRLEDVDNVLTEEFGKAWKDVLLLEKHPSDHCMYNSLGSGCVGHVVKGYLPDGSPVAVKLLHPGVREAIEADVEVVRGFVRLFERLPGCKSFSISESVEEFANMLLDQVDLRLEAHNLIRFRHNFSRPARKWWQFWRSNDSSSQIHFPEPVLPFVSHGAMVESIAEGNIVSAMFDSPEEVRREIARLGLHAMLKMVFEDNFVHADLHPGNICVARSVVEDRRDDTFLARGYRWVKDKISLSPDRSPSGLQLTLIDAGLVACFSEEDRVNFVDTFSSILNNDGKHAGQIMVERSLTGTCLDKEAFSDEIRDIVAEIHKTGLKLGRLDIGALLSRVLVACYKYQVKLQGRYISIIMAVAVLEGMGKRLDPKVDILKSAAPYIAAAALDVAKQRLLKSAS